LHLKRSAAKEILGAQATKNDDRKAKPTAVRRRNRPEKKKNQNMRRGEKYPEGAKNAAARANVGSTPRPGARRISWTKRGEKEKKIQQDKSGQFEDTLGQGGKGSILAPRKKNGPTIGRSTGKRYERHSSPKTNHKKTQQSRNS